MISIPETTITAVAAELGSVEIDNAKTAGAKVVEATGFPRRFAAAEGETLHSLASRAVGKLPPDALRGVGAVVAATFSNDARFPSLAVRIASGIGLPKSAPAFDLQMACSAYPYAVYLAGRIAADAGCKVLVVDGDVQTPLCDAADAATAPLFSDAATASVVESRGSGGESRFAFLSRYATALECPAAGPLKMDGFGVFSFVAAEVAPFLADFLAKVGGADAVDAFVPHQANMYMVRRLAKDLGLSQVLATSGGEFANPGSCSIPLTLAARRCRGRCLLAGFGAGLSAAAALVRVA